MEKGNLVAKISASLVAGAMLVSVGSGAVAFADEVVKERVPFKGQRQERKTNFGGFFQDRLAKMVEDGKITQEQADNLKNKLPEMGGKFKGKGPKPMVNLDKLVEDGTLTQDQADQIKAHMDQQRAERNAEREKVQAMTDEERAAYFEARKAEPRPDFLAELVEAGVISQEQADELKALRPEKGDRFGSRGTKAPISLEKFVEEGTITQEQADQLKAFIDQQRAERESQREKVQAMTDEERKAYFEAKKVEPREHILADAVEAGIISQETADMLCEDMPQKEIKGKGFRGDYRK